MISNSVTLSINQGKLVYMPEHKHSLQNYAIDWLISWRNTHFLKWEQFSSGSKISLYADLKDLIPLEEFLSKTSTNDLYFCISNICKLIEETRNTLLNYENIIFDVKYIFISFNKNNLRTKGLDYKNNYNLKFIYLPEKNFNTKSTKENLKNLLSTIASLIIKRDKRKKKKTDSKSCY